MVDPPRLAFLGCFAGNYNDIITDKNQLIPDSMANHFICSTYDTAIALSNQIAYINEVASKNPSQKMVVHLYFSYGRIREMPKDGKAVNTMDMFKNWKVEKEP
jgi:hypothetical protein